MVSAQTSRAQNELDALLDDIDIYTSGQFPLLCAQITGVNSWGGNCGEWPLYQREVLEAGVWQSSYHVGSGRAPAKAKKAGKRRGWKAAARKPALRRKAKKVVVIPVRRRPAAAPKAAVRASTDVPQALAVG